MITLDDILNEVIQHPNSNKDYILPAQYAFPDMRTGHTFTVGDGPVKYLVEVVKAFQQEYDYYSSYGDEYETSIIFEVSGPDKKEFFKLTGQVSSYESLKWHSLDKVSRKVKTIETWS